MNESYTRNVIEAALLAAGKSLQPVELAQLFAENGRPTLEEIRTALEALANDYAGRGVEIKETAAGFRIQVRREFANEISRLWPERPAKYSRAMLETLALIAYRQPITRGEIEAVRGVAVNPNILKAMIERNWVRVVGHREVPGRPELLGTTRDFLEYFGLLNLDDLPPLAQIKSLGELNMQLELPAPQATVSVDETVALLEMDAPSELLLDAAIVAPEPEQSARTEELAVAESAAAGAVAEADESPQAKNSDAEHGAEHDGERDVEHDAERDVEHDAERDVEREAEREAEHDAERDSSEDDELSADGRGSRELVAAPRDFDD